MTNGLHADPLSALEHLAEELGADELAAEARSIAFRVHEGRFFVACLGQFKRGKSTLLNTLVGADILPVGVTPVTAVVTLLRHGPARSARVRVGTEAWRQIPLHELETYVSEEKNPENVMNVTGVEVFVPSPLLATGLCLVDTPGVGSIFEGNTEATRSFVPHVDAALVVLGADPPISGEELRLVERVAKDVRDFVFVLAKADRSGDEELRQALSFTRRVLAEIVDEPRVLVVSAVERSKASAPTRDWQALYDGLETLARTRGAELVAAAERRGRTRIAASIERDLHERRAALTRPREESERRLASLRHAAREAEHLLADAGPIFAGIEARLARRLEQERDSFSRQAREPASRELEAVVAAAAHEREAQARAIEAAQQIARSVIEKWRSARAPAAENMYREAVDDLVEAAVGALRRISIAGMPDLAETAAELDLATRFRAAPHFYFTEMLTLSGRSLRTVLLGALGGREGKQRALFRRAQPYMLRLIETNSTRVTNDFIEQIRESRRKLESDIKRSLSLGVVAIERALVGAVAAVGRGERGIGDELARLDAASIELRRIVEAGS